MLLGKNIQISSGDETQMSAIVRYQTNNTFMKREMSFFIIYVNKTS